MKRFASLFLVLVLTSCGSSNSGNPSNGHTHTFSNEWSYNEEYHWHESTCEHTDVVGNKSKHSFSNWITDEEATIREKGSKHRNCTICPYVETAEIPVVEHEHIAEDSVIENNIEPTCTSSGSYDEVFYCELCGQEIDRITTTIPATGHLHTATKEGDKKDATCTENGYTTVITYCVDCGQELSSTKQTISATGHIPGEFIPNSVLEGGEGFGVSCTSEYEVYGYYYCKVCGEFMYDAYEWYPPAGHDYQITDSGDATYDHAGYVTYTCSRCGDTYTETTNPQLEHHYGEEWTTNSTYHYHACIDEGYENLKKDEAKHQFISTFVVPTDTTDGGMHRVCEICGYESNGVMTKEQYDKSVSIGAFPDRDGSVVHYGLYPDNLVTDSDKIAELDEAKLAAHKYGQEAIFQYEGKFYRRCAAKNTSNGYSGTTAGQYYYFEMNRVKWRIVEEYDDGSALMISDRILDASIYDDDSCKYADSKLRQYINKWANNSPIDLMFGMNTCGDTYLMKHTVLNSGDTVYFADQYNRDMYDSATTEDYLSIPSGPEIQSWATNLDSWIYSSSATQYAQAMNSEVNQFAPNGNDRWVYSHYWTRTPQSDNYVKSAYGRWHFNSSEPTGYFDGLEVTRQLGIKYVVRVQLDLTKPVNFDSISVLAL